MRITLDLRSPVLRDSELFAEAARRLIAATVLVNIAHLRAFPNTPDIYASGVRYRLEPPDVEDFTDLQVLIDRGWGDCAQLVSWRIAELRVRHNEKATIRVTWVRNPEDGKRMFHIQVRRADRRIEDPSTRLGMRSGEARTVKDLPLKNYPRKKAS